MIIEQKYKCDNCGAENEAVITMIDPPERGSYDYPGCGANWDLENDLTCTACGWISDADDFAQKHEMDIQEKIAESLADAAEPDYPED